MATTIYDCFKQAFYNDVASMAGHDTHTSGNTTAQATPPKFAVPVSVDRYTAKADTVLNGLKGPLRSLYLAPEERGAPIASEGDVVAKSALYLQNPVQIALEATQRNYIHRSEVTKGESSRADKVYYLNGLSIAVLEYKPPGVVKVHEFEHGIVHRYDQFASWMTNTVSRYTEETARFATKLLQQAVHYSEAYDTPFIALFDWNTLVLLVFHKRENLSAGDYCYITVIEERKKFRRALLGFLLLASSTDKFEDKLRYIQPRSEKGYLDKWSGNLQNPGLYDPNPQPSRVASSSKPQYDDNRFPANEFKGSTEVNRGRVKARDNYYPPSKNVRLPYHGGRTPSVEDTNRGRHRDASKSRAGHHGKAHRRSTSESRAGGRFKPSSRAEVLPVVASEYYPNITAPHTYVAHAGSLTPQYAQPAIRQERRDERNRWP